MNCAGGVSEDCDDADPSIWSTPGEVRELTFAKTGDMAITSIPIEPGGTLPMYDWLRSGGPTTFLAAAVCLPVRGDGTGWFNSDAGSPAPGGFFYYLVRAVNGCDPGIGSLGTTSTGDPRPGRSCP